jgi:putative nucleotidyltransferase with HDIG domain
MDNKPQVSRSRQKRTHKRTRESLKREPLITSKLVLCYLLLLVALLVTLNFGRGTILSDLTPGQLAPSTVQAELDFDTIDLSATDLKRERISASVPPVVMVREQPLGEIRRTLDSFFGQVKKTFPDPVTPTDPASTQPPQINLSGFIEDLRLLGMRPELESFPELFATVDLVELQSLLLREIQTVWTSGIINAQDRETSFQGGVPQGAVQLNANGKIQPLQTFPTATDAAETILSGLTQNLELTTAQQAQILLILNDVLEANLVIDPIASRLVREEKVANTSPVSVLRREGVTLIEARSIVTPQAMQDLRAHAEAIQQKGESKNDLSRIFGQGIYLAIGLAISLAFLYLLENPSFKKTNRLFLWVLLTEGSLLLGQFLIYLSADMNLYPGHFLRPLLPLALAPMLGTILYGPRLGLAVGISSSLAHALQHDMDLTIFFCGVSLTITSAISVRAIHRRSNLFRAGLWIGGIKALVIIGAGSLELVPWVIISQQGLLAFSAGLLTSLLVLLLISPFEYLFKVTTDIRLLELSDMSHPLLSRLAMEAPGTYHHSLMVAHLAQAAAREIGANDMLVRVCAYYHDIGKLTKPEFFIENGQGRQNPHDDLSPSMSRLLIISHVKEGVSLARRYKLPAIIVDGIEQHHGTSIIQYFYHRARTRAEENGTEKVKAEDYRYPGPKPRSVEMGILMMADAIEAASRTIDKNKPGQVEGLVKEIIREKLNDGQFDQCRLTMEEINAARRSFIFSLRNMLHGRVEYPKDTDAENNEPATEHPKSGNA